MRRRGWQRPFVKSVKFYTESKTQQPSKSAATFSLSSDTPPTASIFSAPVPCHCTPYPNAQAKGWDTMERALDGFDKQQVEDYKDDIDTLLVFAGLYSAVLTAFVIESYPLLQEDTAVPSPSLSQFEPTPAAVRLNVLWFASLVLSLSTASLGIMVKQWLREYMSFTTSSAQGHLRVRAYRRSGLETWKVFGIASTLPLLLQLSLLLFFVGLCDFTANVHPSIRNTTLSLVCAWAFLIFSVVLAPIFSARCPYKTPALKPMTTSHSGGSAPI
ncbi:hypothetical protein BC835DRAFT_485767 [Cytidiella melzeri]|nr:hypothetical protein BC835DRAFT_485767 [Cytidiella melzeri]